MARVTLFRQSESLPAVANERFCRLQKRVHEQSQRIQSGSRHKSRWLGWGGHAAVTLSPKVRFQELSLLIRHYDAMIDELGASQADYQHFFGQLAAGVQRTLSDKREEMCRIEQERLASYQEAVSQQDRALQQLALEDGERLLQGVRLLGQAALLLLKKIALCQESMTRLASDQALQRQVLAQCIGRLEHYRRAYERRQRIDQVVREVAEMATVAIEFEGYMREHLGPLQDLLDQVVQVDGALHHAVTEIEEITQRMQQDDAMLLPEEVTTTFTDFDSQVLDFLIAAQLKKEHLAEMWRHLERQDGSEDVFDMAISLTVGETAANPVLDALDNIQALVDMRLSPLIHADKTGLRAPRPTLQPPLFDVRLDERSRRHRVWTGLGRRVSPFSIHLKGAPNRFGMTFARIQAGIMQMGSAVFDDEQPVHEVRISRPFYLGKYPVTQGQWEAVMGDNPSYFRGNRNRPVEHVAWEAVQAFIRKLNEAEGRPVYRLPTEAEWEYAARAGFATVYGFGDDQSRLHRYAWYANNSGGKTHPVKQLKPNAWGLFDMHGNVWEWTQDWYSDTYYTSSPRHDPPGPDTGLYRVVRGGGWDCRAGDCRSASRNAELADSCSPVVGFRFLRESLSSNEGLE